MQELHAGIAFTLKEDILKFNSQFEAVLQKEELKEKKKAEKVKAEKEKAEKEKAEKEKAKILGSIVKSNHMIG
jgi:hypothetical protein